VTRVHGQKQQKTPKNQICCQCSTGRLTGAQIFSEPKVQRARSSDDVKNVQKISHRSYRTSRHCKPQIVKVDAVRRCDNAGERREGDRVNVYGGRPSDNPVRSSVGPGRQSKTSRHPTEHRSNHNCRQTAAGRRWSSRHWALVVFVGQEALERGCCMNSHALFVLWAIRTNCAMHC